MRDIIPHGYLCHEDCSTQPEESKETMKWWFGGLDIMPIKCSKLSSEDDLFEFLLLPVGFRLILL